MLNHTLKQFVSSRIFPKVRTPAQYLGGELNMVRKNHYEVRGKLCLAFPDAYSIGMSHHGLQVLYSLMNAKPNWCCERVFAPWPDMEQALRAHQVPLYGLETFTPLCEYDVLGFSLQYEISAANVLTILDLGGIPLRSVDRTMESPLVIAGGPCMQNPEPLAPFFDVVITGDGEPALAEVCDAWLELREDCQMAGGRFRQGAAGREERAEALAELAKRLSYVYTPRWFAPSYNAAGEFDGMHPVRSDIPSTIEPSVISDLDGIPLPTRPIVPFVECVHDRLAIEIMRGCPWQCRFCQSTVIKRPLRVREIETIVNASVESYWNTGSNEVSLLSLSSSDYPGFANLVTSMKRALTPLGVNISVPSLRVNEQLTAVAELFAGSRQQGLTLAPETARDDMREQIRKKISNQDLYDGCKAAFTQGFTHVKLYFLCGLPGERRVDLDGIVEMAETISQIGREVRKKPTKVTASVSNFVPKAHTPYQWNGMKDRAYFQDAHRYMRSRLKIRDVSLKTHTIDTSMLEGVFSRGDRTIADAIELAWKRGARFDSWMEMLDHSRWAQAFADCQIDAEAIAQSEFPVMARLPWDHLNIKKGRPFLEKEQQRASLQLAAMADAV